MRFDLNKADVKPVEDYKKKFEDLQKLHSLQKIGCTHEYIFNLVRSAPHHYFI